ncbi:MAG: carboxylesterase [Nannocystaceae bacterium]|nr:carboxylesterase [Nannocystaceae bacterium]
MTVLDCIEVGPQGDAASGSVIWMHGLGADGSDFVPMVPMLGLPDVRFVFPNAPVMPVTINGGAVMRAWYDITTLERGPDREPEADVRVAAKHIEALLKREAERGVPPGKTVLAGFSQGAAMALHVGPRYEETLAGIMVLSGYRLLPETFAAEQHEANRGTAMLFCHGIADEVLPVDSGREACEFMREHADTNDIAWHEFPIGHSVSEEEIAVVAQWLTKRLS